MIENINDNVQTRKPLIKERKISELLSIQVDYTYDDDTTKSIKISEGDIVQINYINTDMNCEDIVTGRVDKINLVNVPQTCYRGQVQLYSPKKEYVITMDCSKELSSKVTNIFVNNILLYTLVSDLNKEDNKDDNANNNSENQGISDDDVGENQENIQSNNGSSSDNQNQYESPNNNQEIDDFTGEQQPSTENTN